MTMEVAPMAHFLIPDQWLR